MVSGKAPSKKSVRQQQAAAAAAEAEASALLAAASDPDALQEALALTQTNILETVSADLTAQVAEVQEIVDQRLEAGLNRLQTALAAEIAQQIAQLQSAQAPSRAGPGSADIGPQQGAGSPPEVDPAVPAEAPADDPVPTDQGIPAATAGVGTDPSGDPVTTDNPADLLAGVVNPGAAAETADEGRLPLVLDFEKVDWLPPLLFAKRIGPGFSVLPHPSSSGEPAFYPIETDVTYQAIIDGYKGSSVPLHRNETLLEYLVDYCAGYYLACSCEAFNTALQDSETTYSPAGDGHVVMRRDTFNYIAMAAKTATKATSLLRDRLAHIRARKNKTIDNDTVDILAQALYTQPVSHLGSDRLDDLHRQYLAEFDKQVILQGAKNRAGTRRTRKAPGKTPPGGEGGDEKGKDKDKKR